MKRASAATRWFKIRFLNAFSRAGMRCACLASRSTSASERKSPKAGLAARQAFRLHGSESSGALYRVRWKAESRISPPLS